MKFYQPILDRSEFFQGAIASFIFQIIKKNETHAGSDRTHFWFSEALRNLFSSLNQAFPYQLPCEIDVDSVLEIDIHNT